LKWGLLEDNLFFSVILHQYIISDNYPESIDGGKIGIIDIFDGRKT